MIKIVKIILLFVLMLLITSCSSIDLIPRNVQSHNVEISRKIYVDSAFTSEERELIQKSMDAIEYYTDGIIQTELIFGFNISDNKNEDTNKYFNKIIMRRLKINDNLTKYMEKQLSEKSEQEVTVFGYDLKREKFEYIFIVADRLVNESDGKINKKLFQSTVMHETLHVAGLLHYDDSPAIMNAEFEMNAKALSGVDLQPIICLTEADIEQVCKLYLCDPKELKHC